MEPILERVLGPIETIEDLPDQFEWCSACQDADIEWLDAGLGLE
jgi:hypothetical protein